MRSKHTNLGGRMYSAVEVVSGLRYSHHLVVLGDKGQLSRQDLLVVSNLRLFHYA